MKGFREFLLRGNLVDLAVAVVVGAAFGTVVQALVKDLIYELDVNTLHRNEDPASLTLNQLGRVRVRTTVPLLYDDYRRNRSTGSFILVVEASHETLAAGMILTASG